jgi:hypothetical protein
MFFKTRYTLNSLFINIRPDRNLQDTRHCVNIFLVHVVGAALFKQVGRLEYISRKTEKVSSIWGWWKVKIRLHVHDECGPIPKLGRIYVTKIQTNKRCRKYESAHMACVTNSISQPRDPSFEVGSLLGTASYRTDLFNLTHIFSVLLLPPPTHPASHQMFVHRRHETLVGP